MKKACLYLSLLAVMLLSVSCSRWDGRIRGSDLTSLRLGMTKQEVVGVLGKPQSVGANEKYEIYRYYEDHGNWKHVYHGLIFVDDKLKFFGLNGSPDLVKNLEVLE